MPCSYYYNGVVYPSLKELRNEIKSKGWILTEVGEIQKVYDLGDGRKLDIIEDYGSPKRYNDAKALFLEQLDMKMNPDTHAFIEVDDEGDEVFENIPYSRAEAVEKVYQDILDAKDDFEENRDELDDEDLEKLNVMTPLADFDIYKQMVKQFYPNLYLVKDKEGNLVAIDKNQPFDYIRESVDQAELLSKDEDPTGVGDVEDYEKENAEMQGGFKAGWIDDTDTINPLRRASYAVKELMSSVYYGREGEIQKPVDPGYVFVKMIKTMSNLPSNIGKQAELDLISKRFEEQGNFTSHDNNINYAILKRITSLYKLAMETRTSTKQALSTRYKLEWVGDNQRGNYIVRDTQTNKTESLRTPRTIDRLDKMMQFTGLDIDTVSRMYRKAEAIESLTSIHNVINSLREKNPKFAEFMTQWRGRKRIIKRITTFFKNYEGVSWVRDNTYNAIRANYEDLIKYKGLIDEASRLSKEGNKADAERAIMAVLVETKVFPKAYPLEKKLDKVIYAVQGITKALGTVRDVTDVIDGQYQVQSIDTVLANQKKRIDLLFEVQVKYEKDIQRSASYKGGENVQKWFYQLSSTGYETLRKIFGRQVEPIFMRSTFMKNNIFNRVGVNNLNEMHAIADHDSTYDREESRFAPKPMPYKKEGEKDWKLRNFAYNFLAYVSDYTAEDDVQYLQQFYTISNKPGMIEAQVNVLGQDKLKQSIALALKQEFERVQTGALKNYARNKSHITGDGRSIVSSLDEIPARTEEIMAKLKTDAEKSLTKFLKLDPTLDNNIFKAKQRLKDKNLIDKKEREGADEEKFRKSAIMYQGEKITSKEDEFNNAVKYLLPMYELYYANFYVNTNFLNQFIAGDQAFYKNSEDQIKRMSMTLAQGNKGRVDPVDGMREQYKMMVVKDIENTLKDKNFVKRFAALRSKVYEWTDAQGFITPERAANIRQGFSREANLGSAMKPVYFGMNTNAMPVGVKYSTIELTDELCREFPSLAKLRFAMTFGSGTWGAEVKTMFFNRLGLSEDGRLLEGDEKVTWTDDAEAAYQNYVQQSIDGSLMADEAVFASAVKVGLPKNLSTIDPDTGEVVRHPASEVSLYNEYYRHQLNPRHDADSLTSNMSQLTYLMNSNGLNAEAHEKILNLNAAIVREGLKKIIKEFEGNTTTGRVNPKIVNKLIASFEANPGNEKFVLFLKENKNNLNLPLLITKYQQTLISAISKETIDIKHKGAKMVLQSAIGTRETDKLGGQKEPRLVFVDKEGNEVKDADDAHSYYMECYVPESMYKEILQTKGADGKPIMTSERLFKTDIYANILGFRLPSTELHSAVPLRIKGWYPNKHGDNNIIAPKELVLLHGSDFDIDALYTVNPYTATSDLANIDSTKAPIVTKGIPVGYHMSNGKITKTNVPGFKTYTDFLVAEAKTYEKEADKDTQNYVKKVRELISESASNEILDTFLDTIMANRNLKDMMTPITMEVFNDYYNKDSVFRRFAALKGELKGIPEPTKESIRKEVDKYEYIGDSKIAKTKEEIDAEVDEEYDSAIKKWTRDLIYEEKNLNSVDDLCDTFLSNFQGSMLTGMFANAFKAHEYLHASGSKATAQIGEQTLKGGEVVPVTMEVGPEPMLKKTHWTTFDGVVYDRVRRFVFDEKGEYNDPEGVGYVTVSSNYDAMINASIDNVKEQILSIVNATDKTNNAYAVMMSLGIPMHKISLFMSQPSVLEVSRRNMDRKAIDNIKADLKARFVKKMDPAKYKEIYEDVKFGQSGEDRTKAINNVIGKFFNEHRVTTNGMKEGFKKSWDNEDDFSAEDLAFQYNVMAQFDTYNSLGKNYFLSFAMGLRLLKNLQPTYADLSTSMDNLEKFYNAREVAAGGEYQVDPKNPFYNVNPSQVPNIAASAEVAHQTLEFLGRTFLRDNDEFVRLSKMIASKMEITMEDEEEAENTKGIEDNIDDDFMAGRRFDYNVNKNLTIIRENVIEYLLTGVEFKDPGSGREYTFSTKDEPSSTTKVVVERRTEEGEYVKVKEDYELTGTASWIHRFITEGIPVKVMHKGKMVETKTKSLLKLKQQYGNSAMNTFLQNLSIKFDDRQVLPYLRFNVGNSTDTAQILMLQQAFNELHNPNIRIYENEDIVSPPGDFNDLQYNLLKYDVLNNGLAFASNNFSLYAPPKLYNQTIDALTGQMKKMFVTNEIDPKKMLDHFAVQLALQSVDRLHNIRNTVIKEVTPDLKKLKGKTMTIKNKPVAGYVMVGGERVYFDAVIPQTGKGEYRPFAKSGKEAYIKVLAAEGFVFYQKIDRLEVSKAFQYDDAVISKGYSALEKFDAHRLAFGVDERKQVGNEIQVDLNLVNETKAKVVDKGDIVYLYDKSNYSRTDMKSYTVTDVKAVGNKITLTLSTETQDEELQEPEDCK
jgi:hypothetical protein